MNPGSQGKTALDFDSIESYLRFLLSGVQEQGAPSDRGTSNPSREASPREESGASLMASSLVSHSIH